MNRRAREIIAASKCDVVRQDDRQYLIRIWGEAALIPSLKNSKMPGKNFINPEVTAKLIALTGLLAPYSDFIIPYEPRELVWCTVILAQRPTTFDTDNGFAAIKDWLEPTGKKGKRDRKWGIGVVDDDRWVRGVCYHCSDFGIRSNCTVIVLQPFNSVVNELKLLHGINLIRY